METTRWGVRSFLPKLRLRWGEESQEASQGVLRARQIFSKTWSVPYYLSPIISPLLFQLPNGAQVTTIPDLWGKNVGGLLEVKNVKDLSLSNQLRAQIKVASDTGQPLNLVVSPRTNNVSGELMRQVRSTGGDVYRYNPATGDLTKF